MLEHGEAEALAAQIGESGDAEEIVVSAFEVAVDSGDWCVEAYFGGKAPSKQQIERLFGGLAVQCEKLPDTDWVSRSQSLLKPIRARRFFVHGEHDRHKRPAGSISIEIQAGQAFGTGHHGTTQGCLLALDHVLRRGCPTKVLDLGCGSAILAIAFASASKQQVLASDIDPVAIATARENGRLNGASGFVAAFVAPGMHHSRLCRPGQFDLIIANILASPLQRMKRDIVRALAGDGQLILSGITVDQEARLLGSYRPFGLSLRRRWRIDGWSTLLLSR